jgi:hypothetical protein
MELPLPSGVALLSARQVFWLSDQPERVSLPTGFLIYPAVAGLFSLTSHPSPITAAGPPRIRTGFRIAWGVFIMDNLSGWPRLVKEKEIT